MSNDGLKKKGTMIKFDVVSRAIKAKKVCQKVCCTSRASVLLIKLSFCVVVARDRW